MIKTRIKLILKKFIIAITTTTLTIIVKIIRNNDSNINIATYLIDEELKYQIHGVNTQQELKDLEEKY